MLQSYNMSREINDDLIYKALADSRRREILDLLRDEPLTTGDICKRLEPLDRCTVMQHLRVLEKAGLVFTQKKGRYRWNYLNAVPICEIYERWINKFASHSVGLITGLKRKLDQLET